MNADVTVREVIDREFVGVSESDDLLETVALLLEEGVESALVLRGSTPVGVLTERSVLGMLVDGVDIAEATVDDAMIETVRSIDADQTVRAAADMVSTGPGRRLVVTHENEGEPLGILTEQDLLASTTYPTGERGLTEGEGTTQRSLATEETQQARPEAFDEQGICESCGTLSRDLVPVNGQMLCNDCRAMT